MVCLGCAEVTHRPSDRRKLKSSASQHVLPLWKHVVTRVLEKRNQQADLDGLLCGYGNPERGGQMCRKCFYAYEKVLKAQAVIESSVTKVVDVIIPVSSRTRDVSQTTGTRVASSSTTSLSPPPAPKRRPPPPVFAHTPSTSMKSQSPDVVVTRIVRQRQTSS